MRPRSVLLGLVLAVLSIAAIAGVVFVWFKYTPRRTPVGQPALSRLDAAMLPAFREAFNASDEETRLIVLLSPT